MAEPISICAQDLLKTTGILRASPDTTLSAAFAKLSRSHDVVFVFDSVRRGDDKFLGVVSPHYALFKKHFPPETKVKNCLFHPPKLTPQTPFWEIAQRMRESRLYFLPVFSTKKQTLDDEFIGIVSVRRLFDALSIQKNLISKLSLVVKRDVVTIKKSATADEAYNLLRNKKLSRVVVVDDNGREVGIVTHYGLQIAMSQPRQGQSKLSRKGIKRKYLNQPLSKYYKNMVVTAPVSIGAQKLFYRMLTEDTSCIVVLDSKRCPVGIVSTSDVLFQISRLAPEKSVAEEVVLPKKFLHDFSTRKLLRSFAVPFQKLHPMRAFHFMLKANKNRKKSDRSYTAFMRITLKNGKELVSSVTGYEWKKSIQQVFDKIRRQVD